MAPPTPPTDANDTRLLPDAIEVSSARPTMAESRETRDGKPLKSAANESTGERLHSTVRLNQFTLQFEDAALEAAYKAYSHRRKKALWLRSLIPATAFHILFGLSDCLEHPPDHLLVTVPARVFLSVLQISMFILVRWDLVSASETTMLLVSICNGIPTLLLYALQRSSLHQWDALFVVFGLSFYTIPKITPLGFVASLVGSWLTAILYAGLSFLVRPPMRPFESLLGFLYCAPVIGIFNTISYYSEYNSRERFVLRRRLRSESITLAVSRTKALPSVGSLDRTENVFRANKFILGVLLWGATTLGGWTSLPDVFKFVDEDTGWAWFSHCAGLTMFLLVMTRQLQWLFVVPLLGALLLWMMSLAMPASWIIISAHSMGYGLLFASIVIAMGVFSRFVSVWRELVSFLTRSCFLYPQLQAGLQDEYPLLVKIVSEYTAGMDPAIMSSRDLTNRALTFQAASSPSLGLPVSPMSTDVTMRLEHQSSISQHRNGVTPQLQASSRSPPRWRMLTAAAFDNTELNLTSGIEMKERSQSQCGANSETAGPRKVSVDPRSPRFEEPSVSEPHPVMCNKMISVLPSFKAGKCFFCTKNEAEHLVPACGMWGKWTHWRMSQQQDIMFGSLALPSSPAGDRVVGKPVQAMCTSYYDVQQNKAELEQRVEALEKENHQLRDEVAASQRRALVEATTLAQIQGELRAQEERHLVERHRNESVLQKKMDQMISEANHIAHDHKMQLRELEIQNRKLMKELRETCQAAATDLQNAQEVQQRESEENQRLQAQVQELRQELEALRSSTSLADGNVDTATAATSENAAHEVALHPSRRLPYARWIEVEGLRESIRKKDVDAAVDETPAWSVGRP